MINGRTNVERSIYDSIPLSDETSGARYDVIRIFVIQLLDMVVVD